MTAELAAWWQRNNTDDGEVITLGAITELAIPSARSGACIRYGTNWARDGPRRAAHP
jgi:hypothetical protein